MIRRLVSFILFGRLCPRCKEEPTGHWSRYVTGVPFDEWVCHTCHAVEAIRRIEIRHQPKVWGPEVEGADQISPGLYVGRENHSIFTKDKK